MEMHEFQKNMERLKKAFGPFSVPDERMELVWKETQTFSVEWFDKIITNAIMTMHHAPMLPYFYEQASIERDRVRAIEKAKESREAIQGYGYIRERTTRDWSDEERREKFGAAIKTLEDMGKEPTAPEYDF